MNRLPFTHKMLGKIQLGQKHETRRVAFKNWHPGQWVLASCNHWRPIEGGKVQLIHPGMYDQLSEQIKYATASALKDVLGPPSREFWRCYPSIHMPAWLCQGGLKIVRVDREPLEAITDEGAIAEGFDSRAAFLAYFEQLNPSSPLSQEVQVIEFKAFTMAEAFTQGGLNNLVLKEQLHWPSGWRRDAPNWLRLLPTIEATK